MWCPAWIFTRKFSHPEKMARIFPNKTALQSSIFTIKIHNSFTDQSPLARLWSWNLTRSNRNIKGKGRPYSITKCRVPELIPVLGSQPAGDVSHKPGGRGRLPLLSATLKRAATSFAAWWTEAQWVWVCLRLLPDSAEAAIWTRAVLRLSPAR